MSVLFPKFYAHISFYGDEFDTEQTSVYYSEPKKLYDYIDKLENVKSIHFYEVSSSEDKIAMLT